MVLTMAPLLVGTDDGLFTLGRGSAPRQELSGSPVQSLVRDDDRWWTGLGGEAVWRLEPGRGWGEVVRSTDAWLNCLCLTSIGLLIGASEARLFRLDGDGLEEVTSFQQTEGRDAWYTPWGGPPDVRSVSAADGALYANVHVGGVVRSGDGGVTWEPTMDIDADVHQVWALNDGLVRAASAWGLGVSMDGGTTWEFQTDGLHGDYLRAVAVSGHAVFVTASEGHRGRRSAVYRRSDSDVAFVKCTKGLPDWFGSNIDTFCLIARGDEVVFGTEEGSVYRSQDDGATWEEAATGLPSIRCVAFG
jgi:hypothetical protein